MEWQAHIFPGLLILVLQGHAILGSWHQEEKLILQSIPGCQRALFKFPYLLSKTSCATVRFFFEIGTFHLGRCWAQQGSRQDLNGRVPVMTEPLSEARKAQHTSVPSPQLEDRLSHWLKWSLKDSVTAEHLEQLQVCISAYIQFSFKGKTDLLAMSLLLE